MVDEKAFGGTCKLLGFSWRVLRILRVLRGKDSYVALPSRRL
jgi:hypothetical protein